MKTEVPDMEILSGASDVHFTEEETKAQEGKSRIMVTLSKQQSVCKLTS